MRLQDKVAVVTGGTRGIGRAAAVAMAEEGARVCIVGRSQSNADTTLDIIKQVGGEAIAVTADVRHKSEVERIFDETRKAFGPVDIVVTSAGIWSERALADLSEEDWDEMQGIHVKGTLFCIQAALDDMIERQGGAIITLSSPAATVGARFLCTHYAAAKGAIIGMTKTAAKELAKHHIRVNCVSPAVFTDMSEQLLATYDSDEARQAYYRAFPLGVGEPVDIAGLFVFLASTEGHFITGQILNADGGLVM